MHSTCSPVGEDLEAEADERVAIQLADYAFVPDDVTVAPGVVTFAATNAGGEAHELAFLPRAACSKATRLAVTLIAPET